MAQQRMIRAQVPENTAAAYAKTLSAGAVLLVIRATYKPLGAARIAREMTANSATLHVAGVRDEVEVQNQLDHASSVLKDHPRFLSFGKRSGGTRRSGFSDPFGQPSTAKPHDTGNALDHNAQVSSKTPSRPSEATASAAPSRDRGFISRVFGPRPMVPDTPRGLSVSQNSGPVFSRLFGWPTILRR